MLHNLFCRHLWRRKTKIWRTHLRNCLLLVSDSSSLDNKISQMPPCRRLKSFRIKTMQSSWASSSTLALTLDLETFSKYKNYCNSALNTKLRIRMQLLKLRQWLELHLLLMVKKLEQRCQCAAWIIFCSTENLSSRKLCRSRLVFWEFQTLKLQQWISSPNSHSIQMMKFHKTQWLHLDWLVQAQITQDWLKIWDNWPLTIRQNRTICLSSASRKAWSIWAK